MKPLLGVFASAVLLIFTSTCFALWDVHLVSKKQAKKLGMEVRSTEAGPNRVRVELEFKTEGNLKDVGQVELQFGEGDNPPLVVPLREDRSKAGRVLVNFTTDRDQLDKIKLWVMVPELTGGTVYQLQMDEFVAARPAEPPPR